MHVSEKDSLVFHLARGRGVKMLAYAGLDERGRERQRGREAEAGSSFERKGLSAFPGCIGSQKSG